MKAVRIHGHGGIDKLRYEEVEEPRLTSPTEAIVRLESAALNRIDLWNREGLTGMDIALPHILGADGAGIVESLGLGCESLGFVRGDEVVVNPGVSCMRCEFCLRGAQSECPHFRIIVFQLEGLYAEYASVPAVNLFPKPRTLSWEEAESLINEIDHLRIALRLSREREVSLKSKKARV